MYQTIVPIRFVLGQLQLLVQGCVVWDGDSTLLSFDEAIASRAVFVIVFMSDGRKRFWSELSNSKTVRDRSIGELIGTHGRVIEWAHPPTPYAPPP